MSTLPQSVRRRLLRTLAAATLAASAGLLGMPQPAAAQPKGAAKEPTPEEKKGYTLPYFFTIVGVLAVASPLCWPSGRKWEVPLQGEA